ncbi:zinc-finger domain-containing protein [Arenimonas maotaiensis]|uniref:Zinc-finger domain-containing protein n=1 Tax=Arenimonas maotaiensis TaxID=1446479 RepID=A0A917CU57_9GAMM|nr:zinc-finger domain-containing protein [Arenimonas maotaiensis]GGF97866.1 zinc-finger domain-containing protein [Arenimonas maotaiensis]
MTANAANTPKDTVIEVRRAQLPLTCPTPDMALWNQHPKVSIPIEANGQATCPYCGARYRLAD